MTTLSDIASSIDDNFENNIFPVLEKYAAIECVSPVFDASWKKSGNIDRAAALLSQWCVDQQVDGAAVEIVELEGRTPLLFIEVPANDDRADTSTTLIYGHFDKQPALGEWREGLEAFRLVREGDRLYGRGVADDGYATFSAFAALSAMEAVGATHGRLAIIIESSEESGSPDLDAYIEHLAHRLGNVQLVICLDSGCTTYDRLWLTTSLRGLISGELRVEVLEEGVHSGLAGGIVPSSFRICRELLSRIEDESSGEILMSELHVSLPSYRREEIEQVAHEFGDEAAGVFPAKGGLTLAGATVADRVVAGTWEPALEVTGAAGLPSLEDAGNVLRPFTTLKLSVRLPPTCDPELASAALQKVLCDNPPSGASVTFHLEQQAAGWDAPAHLPWLSEAIEKSSVEFFGASPRSMGMGGSIPFMASLGHRFPEAQFLVTGVLGPQSNAHGPNEFLHFPTAKAVTATVAHVLSVTPR